MKLSEDPAVRCSDGVWRQLSSIRNEEDVTLLSTIHDTSISHLIDALEDWCLE